MSNKLTVPTLEQLVSENELSVKQNNLMVLLNQEPPKQWLVPHPMVSGHKYLPIERVEYILSRVFKKWWVDILSVQTIANSAVVTVRLNVIDPITGEIWHNDGVGAMAIQTDKGAGAMEWDKSKADGVMKAVPSAETYAIKDAADKFGKLFGKDVGRKIQIDYNNLVKEDTQTETDEKTEDARFLKFLSECITEDKLDSLLLRTSNELKERHNEAIKQKEFEILQNVR